MQLKDKEKAINEQLDMISMIASKYHRLFKYESRSIDAKDDYNWGGNIVYHYKNGVKFCIGVGFEKRGDVIFAMVGLEIFFENTWKSLGLFVKKRAVYDKIKMKCSEENIENLLNIFIQLMNETDELKPIYLDEKE